MYRNGPLAFCDSDSLGSKTVNISKSLAKRKKLAKSLIEPKKLYVFPTIIQLTFFNPIRQKISKEFITKPLKTRKIVFIDKNHQKTKIVNKQNDFFPKSLLDKLNIRLTKGPKGTLCAPHKTFFVPAES